MAVTTQHSLYAVELLKGAGNVRLGGLTADSMPMGSQVAGEGSSGSLWPQIVSLTGQNPTRGWATKELVDHLLNFNSLGDTIGHTLVGGNPGLRLWQYKHAAGGTRTTGATHRSITFNQGIVIPGGITVEHQGDAVMTYAAIPVSLDGIASPTTIAENQAVPTAVVEDKRFTMGPFWIDGVQFTHVKAVEVSFGVTAVAEGSDSDIFPSQVSVRTVTPSILLRGIDTGWFSNAAGKIPALGRAFDSASSVFFLRKRLQGGAYVPDGTTEHIRFNFTGIAVMDQVHDATFNDPSEMSLRLVFRGGLTGLTPAQPPMTISSTPGGVAITSL